MKWSRFLVVLAVLAVIFAPPLLAQEAEASIDPGTVDNIMNYSLMGLSIAGVTEALKRLLKLTGTWAKVLWGAVCVAFTAVYIWQTGMFSVVNLLVYSFAVVVTSFGIYKFSAAKKAT